MFKNLFEYISTKIPEIEVIAVIGKDGLVIDRRVIRKDKEENDIDFFGAELTDVVQRIDRSGIGSEGYFVQLRFHSKLLMLSSYAPEFFIIAIAPSDFIANKFNFFLNNYKLLKED